MRTYNLLLFISRKIKRIAILTVDFILTSCAILKHIGSRVYYLFAVSICSLLLVLFTPTIVSGQTGEWKVWVKTSPCSGRNDWITVAKDNPTIGGLSFYYLANNIFPGTSCTNFGCSYAEAQAVATSLRSSDQFFKYCCRDYSVWENTTTRKRSVVLGKFGTAGFGWVFIKGDLCCEEAEALAGIPGACSGTINYNQQDIVKNTKCWPGSYAAWNAQANRVECFCITGLVWNSTKTACVDPKDLVKNTDCSVYPGSYAAWNEQAQRVECYCPTGKAWNSTRTACVDNPAQVNCWPGSYAAFNPQTNRTECFCNTGLVWNSTKTACVDPKELVKTADCSIYAGSYAAWNEQAQRVECYCPDGKVWNSTKTACVDISSQVTCYPGSHAVFNPQSNRTECFCNTGLVWNSTKTACVDPKDLAKNADCSGYPGSYGAWNEQTQRVECWCPAGKVWNSTKTACVDANTGGSGTWSLVSVTTMPAPLSQGWSVNAQGGTAHYDVYNGDKADFQWSPPPQKFDINGFTISLNVQSKPLPNSRLAALISVGGSGITLDNPSEHSAYANAPEVKASDQKSVSLKPASYASEIELKVVLMWGSVVCYYKYRKN